MKIMRRMLLRAGSAAALLGASAFSLAQPRPRLRLAIIGTGMRGQVLLQELIRRDDVDVVALCDIEPIMLKRAPWRAALVAAARPAGPPPTTTTSNSPNTGVRRAGSSTPPPAPACALIPA